MALFVLGSDLWCAYGQLPEAIAPAEKNQPNSASAETQVVPGQTGPMHTGSTPPSKSSTANEHALTGGEETPRRIDSPQEDTGPKIEEVVPELFYLRDKDGRLVPVPGFSYEDFLELFKLKQRLARPQTALPDYSIQQMLVTGEASEQSAALTVRFDLRVRKPDWVRVPLGLGPTPLDGAATYEGRGDYLLAYDEKTDAHVAWIRGTPGAEHRLTLKIQAPLTTGGMQHRLSLALPHASTSKLTLTVPGRQITASVAPGSSTPEVAVSGESSVISLLGVGGALTLDWSDKSQSPTQAETVLESSGVILVKIDGRSVTTEASLQVRSFGGPFERFHVRLPKGAVLTGAEQTGYTLAPVGQPGDSLIEVRLDKAAAESVEVKLTTERAFDVTKPELLEFAGFQVIEAAPHRQGGQIGVMVSGDWQVIWETRSRVRQIDEPVESLRRRDLLAAFEYVGQPSSLTARVVARRSKISVDPEYVCYIDAEETRLEAKLKYSIRGAKVFALEIEMPGWELDEIGPETAIDAKSIFTAEDGRTRIPLSQPTIGDMEIELRAHRRHTSDSPDIELGLPVLTEAIVGPATLLIVPAENVELVTKTEALIALSPQRTPPSLELAHKSSDLRAFRVERANAKYVAAMKVRSQKIGVQVANAAEIRRAGIEVTQRFDYQVLYEPVVRLNFSVPQPLVADNRLSWFIDDVSVAAHLVAANQGSGNDLRVQLELPEPRTGALHVICRYDRPAGEIRPGTNSRLEIPLVMPLEGEFGQNTLDVLCEAGMAIEVGAGHWKLVDQDATEHRPRWRLAAATAASSASISVIVDERPILSPAKVERGWVQTWLADQTRQERAVYYVSSTQPRLSLTLPDDAIAADAEVLLDREPIRPTLNNGQELLIPWPSGSEPHVVDVRYAYASAQAGAPVTFHPPSFGEGVGVRRLYWHVIVPGNRHLLNFASGLAPEFKWQMSGLFCSRRNLLTQTDLEDWTQATHEPLPPQAVNEYLFSLIGEAASNDVWLAQRSSIVFCGSVVVLGIALLVMYARWLRRPQALIVGGAVLLVLALAFPGPAILFGQGAVVGLVLAIVAAVLRRAFPDTRVAEDLAQPPSSSIIERTVTDIYAHTSGFAPHASTAAAVTVERSSSDSGAR